MQLLIGFGPIVEELKVISKEEERKISTCKMLFPSISFLRALLPDCVSDFLTQNSSNRKLFICKKDCNFDSFF